MAGGFRGFDHIDVRVRSLAAVEPFYDRLMPELGLPHKTVSHVDETGEWRTADDAHPYNAIEYDEGSSPGGPPRFIGFIEDPAMQAVATRIAFRMESQEAVRAWASRLEQLGACAIELGAPLDEYPAVFFEDPAGTRLELCARKSPR